MNRDMEDREYQKRLRNGTLPVITTPDMTTPKFRVWVNSEKFPWCGLEGYRVLHNDTIFERKKRWWIFGKWVVVCNKTKDMEVYVLDEAVIR